MTYQEIYDAALRVVCEDPAKANDDYLERAPYLLATLVSQCAPLDASYREAHLLPAVPVAEAVSVPLSDTFPLAPAFAAPATYYLGAMLVIDENEELSDRLYDLFSDALAKIQSALPTSSHSIIDRYDL